MLCGSPRALHLPPGLCACLSPAHPQHSSTGCRSSPCSPSSPHEEPIWGICPPILPHEAKGRGHLGKVWRRDREEGASSSVSVTCMQIPVSQRRGLHPPRVQAEAGSSLSHAASRCPWGALLSSRTSKNYFKPNPCKAAICSCVSVAARPPGSSFSPLWGGGGEKYIYKFICRGPRCNRSPPQPHLSASMVTLAFCSAVACWETVAGQPAGCAGGVGVHMVCCWPGGEAVGQAGLKAPCWGSGGAGGGGDVAIEATGLLLLKLSEALRRENMVRASGKLGGVAGVLAGVHICGRREAVSGAGARPQLLVSIFCLPLRQCPSALLHTKLPGPDAQR